MRSTLHRTTLAVALALLFTGASTASASGTPQAGTAGGTDSTQTVNVTLMLRLRDEHGLERYIQQTVTPGNPNFQRFLSTSQFARRYGAPDAEIARVKHYLATQGLRGEVMANHLTLQASGTLAQFGKVFGTPIHSYRLSANGRLLHHPTGNVVMPAALAGQIDAVVGLDNESSFLSHRLSSAQLPRVAPRLASLNATGVRRAAGSDSNPTASGQPGEYTVGDVANFYNINPLYQRGITGTGSTVAIVTLADFEPTDAEAYWEAIGLTTRPHRIEQIHVDGGGGINGGSGETALDVEQAGGLAPDAEILVYDAPNTNSSFVNALAQAVVDNRADSISTSWGAPEIYNFAALNVDGASADDTHDVGTLRAFHTLLMEAAAQGQSVFAAAGDSGAYDTVRGLGHGTGAGEFSAPLTVDSPASDPYITAAGGTTTPFSFAFGNGPVASVSQESVWGWDYLQNYFDANFGKGAVDLFSVGGGGGVSSYWPKPFYQYLTQGIRRTEADQSLDYNDPAAGPTTLLELPSHFAGRNLPDISLNADPETGYLVYSSTDGGVTSGQGGTSFVAPQLNGITALLRQSSGHRIGLWNPQMYFLQAVFGYGRYSPFNSVGGGDNWFYQGAPHYTPGAGLGTLDVGNLDLFMRSLLRF